MATASGEVTELLHRLKAGDKSACDPLIVWYDELRRLANGFMRRERIDHTLQPTALVHEAWLRLIDQRPVSLDNAMATAVESPAQLLDVHRALERLNQLDPRRAQLAEMRFFGGLSIQEIAELTGVTPRTVESSVACRPRLVGTGTDGRSLC